MEYATVPSNEQARLCAVYDLGILDSLPDERYDAITKKATQLFHVPISTISILDKDREWYKSRRGVAVTEAPRNISFCGHALLQEEILIIEDTLLDPRFADNPYVKSVPGIRFYAGKSLHKSGNNFPIGVFCIKDYQPRVMSLKEINLFMDLAEEAEELLNEV